MLRKWVVGVALGLVVFALLASAALAYFCMMPGESFAGVAAHDQALAQRLQRHVAELAGAIGERRVGKGDSLLRARAYLERELGQMGYEVNRHSFGPANQGVANLVVERRGTGERDEILVVGAHYDSAEGTPGANDNATGTAALLELARRFHPHTGARTLRFVFFANEEPPYFQREFMGSLAYAHACRARKDNLVGMLSLESLGYFTDAPDTQAFPSLLGLIYPSAGNFVGFIGDVGSRGFVRDVLGRFRKHAHIASEGFAGPRSIRGIGWSDHWSFWQIGVPAVMVTDTATYRDPAYHEAFDTPERVSYGALAHIVAGLTGVIDELAKRDE